MQSSTPMPVKRAVISRDLHCRKCGYNVRGVRLESACPECGLAVQETVTAEVDPQASELPQLRNPVKVGNALLWLMVTHHVFTVVLAAPGLERVLSILRSSSPPPTSAPIPHPAFPLIACAIALAAIPACRAFAYPLEPSDRSVYRLVRWMLLAILVAVVCGTIDWFLQAQVLRSGESTSLRQWRTERGLAFAAYALGGMAMYFGVGGILRLIGERSRTYREARGGRQSAQGMVLALAIVAVSSLAMSLGATLRQSWLWQGGRFITVAGVVMLVIGQLYLLVNAWWIRAALRKPPARLSELVRIEPEPSSE